MCKNSNKTYSQLSFTQGVKCLPQIASICNDYILKSPECIA